MSETPISAFRKWEEDEPVNIDTQKPAAANMWEMEFRKVQVGEEFANEDGDYFEKTSNTEGQCIRTMFGAHCEGDTVDFKPTDIVTLKN